VTIALFDLDGTITRRDTLVPYVLRHLARRPWRLVRLVALLPALVSYGLGPPDRGRLKSALIRCALGGESRSALAVWTAKYVTDVVPARLHRDALAAIERHRAAGDRLVLLSASPDFYVPAIGERLGFDEVICTQVAWRGDRLEGALLTENRRGPEKLRVLEALRARHPGERIVGYANSDADLEHLERCDEAWLVNGPAPARRAAAAAGVHCVGWR